MTPVRAGILVAAKPAGVTSFGVVAAVRRALGVRRVGHAGTLDPDATGVLPIMLGEATKLMPYLADQDKEYRVVVRFGVTTDTLDMSGRVMRRRPVAGIDRKAVEAVAARFIGTVAQVPPMHSAVHHGGRRLYELARAGVEVERSPRSVAIHAITVDDVDGERATLTVVCGKGTYVRALAADLGEALGVGGAVDELARTRVGRFALASAVDWEAITRAASSTEGRTALWQRVLPAESAIEGWPAIVLDDAGTRAFLHGQAVPVPAATSGPAALRRVHDPAGVLLGVGEMRGDRVRPLRILRVDHPGSRVLPA